MAAAGLATGLLALLQGVFRGSASMLVLAAVLAGALVASAGRSARWVRGRLEGNGIHLRVHRAFADGAAFVRAVGRSSPEASAARVRTSLPPV